MQLFFATFLAGAWYLVYIVCFMVLPELIVYCVWRFLKDLRRIARALESAQWNRLPGTSLEQSSQLLPEDHRPSRISLSAFGR